MDSTYHVVLITGDTTASERTQLSQRLAKAFKIDEEKAARLAGAPHTIIKRGLTRETAEKLTDGLERLGCQSAIVADGESFDPETSDSTVVQNPPAAAADQTVILSDPTSPGKSNGAPAPSTHEASSAKDLDTGQSPYEAPESSLQERTVFCRQCGEKISEPATNCPSCQAPQITGKRRSKVVAGFLALFLGGWGIHRFYLGQWWGILYLLFNITLIPSIVSLIEAFVFFLTPEDRWNEKYGNVQRSPWLILVVGLFLFVMIMGILAAVAVPQYQNYVKRAKVAEVITQTQPTRLAIEQRSRILGSLPTAGDMVDIQVMGESDSVSRITLGDGGTLIIEFKEDFTFTDGSTLIFRPQLSGSQFIWSCSEGTLPSVFRPEACRP